MGIQEQWAPMYITQMADLQKYAYDKRIEVNFDSEKDFTEFLEFAPMQYMATLELMKNGNYRAFWQENSGIILVQFLGNGLCEYLFYTMYHALEHGVANVSAVQAMASQAACRTQKFEFSPPLGTERLTLKAPKRSDAFDIHKAIRDPNIGKAIFSEPVKRLANAEQLIYDFLNSAGYTSWTIRIKDGKEEPFVGMIWIHNIHWKIKRCFMDFFIVPEHQRQGFASESVNRVFQQCFDVWNFKKICVAIRSDDKGANEAVSKIGFDWEAELKDDIEVWGEVASVSRYFKLKKDWDDNAPPVDTKRE